MITVKNISDEDHKNELQEMIHDYYEDALGDSWTRKIPSKFIREVVNRTEINTEKDVKKIYDEDEKRLALGLYDDRDNLVGFTSVVVFEDKVGGIYQIYIKPEYREVFIKNFKGSTEATEELTKSLEAYFKNMGANEVIMEAPRTVSYLLHLAQNMGFIVSQEYEDATELSKPLK